MNAAFSYYGGKQRMAKNIVPLLPKHTVYVEPFAGGLAVMFNKPLPRVTNGDHYSEVANDLDGRIVNFYRVLQDKSMRDELIDRLAYTPYSSEMHDEAKKYGDDCPVYLAWCWYVDTGMSFSSISGTGFRRSVYGRSNAHSWSNKRNGLDEVIERMDTVHIDGLDAIECIERWDSPQTLFYVDPPYPGAEQGYKHQYSHDDFSRLVDALDDCSGSFLLSAYDVGLCPEHWERFEFDAAASSSGKGQVGAGRDKSRKATSAEMGDRKRTEVAWRMDRSMTARPEIIDLYRSGKFDCFGGPLPGLDGMASLPLFSGIGERQ